MKYILDTNIVVDHLRGRNIVDKEILSNEATISIITLGELFYGAYKSTDPEKALTKIRDTIERLTLTIIPIDESVIHEFAIIKSRLEKKGKRLEDFDLLIAATAKTNDMTLVTHNKKHFERIPDLQMTS